MDLQQFRTLFRDVSGRHDLVDDDAKNTVDFLINSGCVFLDGLTETTKSFATHYRFLSQGSWYVTFPRCRAVKEIWVASRTARWQLEKQSMQDLFAGLLTEKVTGLDQGDPLYYAPVLSRIVGPAPGIAELDNFIDRIVVQEYNYNAALILPPNSEKILVEIRGLFYSNELIDEKDKNYWTESYPNILLKAVMREMDIFEHNPERIAGWESAIKIDLDGINKDLVDQQIAEVTEMEG